MLHKEKNLIDRYLPQILEDNPGLAEKISAMPDPGAAALAVVKNSPDYAYDQEPAASDETEASARIGNWFKTAPTSDFLAYSEKVKNETAEGCAPWNEGLSSGPPYSLDNPTPAGGMIPGTTMDIFGRPRSNGELADEQKGERMLLAGMLSDGTIHSVTPSAETVLGQARHLTNQMTKDGLRSDFFWENGWHSRTYGGNYLSCVHQAEYLKPLMEKKFPDWKFEVDAGPLHTVLIGIPPGWNEPQLKLDPWYGSFSVIAE